MRCFKNFKRKRLVLVYLLLGIVILTAIIIHNHSFNLNRSFQNNGKSYNYDGAYPGNFMETYKPSNESYCNFMYNLPEEFTYEESDLEYSPELGIRSPYRVLYNVIRSKENFSSAASVTYATHLTTEFVSYITEVVRYWEGPLSVAAFVPDSDADILTKGLIHLCQCLPEMSKVSVHYVFPKRRTPVISKHSELSQTSFCSISHMRNVVTFRNRKSSPYPVNVCRNVARNASTTNFVLVSDVELIPSIKLASRFLDTISRLGDTNILNYPSRVFVVPVFEIESYEDVPKTKKDLLRLITQEKAVYFHRHICSHCQKFPGIEQWLGQDSGNTIKVRFAFKLSYVIIFFLN